MLMFDTAFAFYFKEGVLMQVAAIRITDFGFTSRKF